MLTIDIVKSNEIVSSVTFNGHAKYDNYGKDIVCASASAILNTSANAILEFDSEAIYYKEENNKVTINNLKKDEITNKLLNNMILCLEDLEKQYPNNIKIR